MRLSNLLSVRTRLTVGELSQIGTGVVRSLTARRYLGLKYAALGLSDIEVLSNGGVVLRDSFAPDLAGFPGSETCAEAEVVDLAQLLLLVARRAGVVGTKAYPEFHAAMLAVIREPILLGDFAVLLHQNWPPTPVGYRDKFSVVSWLQPGFRGFAGSTTLRFRSLKAFMARCWNARQHSGGRVGVVWNLTWVTPSLLGLIALATWGLAGGLLLGI